MPPVAMPKNTRSCAGAAVLKARPAASAAAARRVLNMRSLLEVMAQPAARAGTRAVARTAKYDATRGASQAPMVQVGNGIAAGPALTAPGASVPPAHPSARQDTAPAP